MEKLYELKELLMDSLDELDTMKGHKLKMGELEAIKYITSAMDHLCNVIGDMEEEGGTSQYGGRRMYPRDGGGSYRRGRSRDGGNSYAVDKLYEAERSAHSDKERDMIRQLRERMENM